MASKYDDLDTIALETTVTADLAAAYGPRGCVVTHRGTATSHAPGGGSDIHLVDIRRKRLVLIEVTKRRGSAADGEFAAITEHLDDAVSEGKFSDYCCLYVSPATSARMSANLLDRHNAIRDRQGKPGRIIAIDFETFEEWTDHLRKSDHKLYPASRLGALFTRWREATDDPRVRRLVAEEVLAEDNEFRENAEEHLRSRDAETEARLRRGIQKLEDRLRDTGVTGNNANTTLVYLTFARLYEDKRARETGAENRFTLEGFIKWKNALPVQVKREYGDRLCEYLISENANDTTLSRAGLLRSPGKGTRYFHADVTDQAVEKHVLPLFDEYRFHGASLDVLGVVFETLAPPRGEGHACGPVLHATGGR